MIRKNHLQCVDYSIVESDEANSIFAAALPYSGDSFEEQAESALDALNSAFRKENAEDKVVFQTVFLQDNGQQEPCRQIMRRFYRDTLPPTSYVVQPPCCGNRLAIEAWAVADRKNSVQVERIGDDISLVRSKGKNLAYFADLRPVVEEDGTFERSLNSFQSAERQLQKAGMTFDDVLRTWIYLGDITATEKQTTRYFELNRARTHFYQGRQFAERLLPRPWNRSAYPASTGIGTRGRDIVLGGIAVDAKSGDVVVVPMENPDQTAACDYAHRYGNDSPKFSRAMALFSGDSATIFISGTASITASDTRHAENCRLQTEQTLENIEKLVSRENFRRHGFDGAGATLENMALARVYLKRAEDYALVRELCVNRLKNAPVLYIVGDICRPELLVEIEAVAFCRR